MIKSKEDYYFYLQSDKLALGIEKSKPSILGDEVWKFQRTLRKTEYYMNCKNSTIWKTYICFLKAKLHIYRIILGFSIYPNVFGPGLSIAHVGTIVVNSGAKVGENCRLHHCVTIGTKAGHSHMSPQIGNNCFIGPGASVFGDIRISDDVAIGSNSVVNKSFLERGITIAGAPAKKISNKGSFGLLIKATDIIRNSK